MAKMPTFLNLDFGRMVKARALMDSIDPNDWHYDIEGTHREGYKFTISSNNRLDGTQLSCMDKGEKSANKEYCISVWGGTIGECYAFLLWFIRTAESEKTTWKELHTQLTKIQKEDDALFNEFVEWKRSQQKD